MSERPLRVLVVDDSAINRRSLSGLLSEHGSVEVVGTASGGDEALRLVAALAPDLITLDLEMPRMDGFTFLRLLMASRPTPVIVVSTHSAKENVFRALELGAIDFIAKPDHLLAGHTESIRGQLDQMVRVVRQLAPSNWRSRHGLGASSGPTVGPPAARPAARSTGAFSTGGSGTSSEARFRGLARDEAPPLRPPLSDASGRPSKVVVIASSTGGPTALLELFSRLPAGSNAAILVAQHMPERFTKAFAERLDRLSAFRVLEADEHQLLLPGTALVCPGGRCLELRRAGSRYSALVLWPDKDDRYAPSADRLFISAARVCAADAVGVVLTGMGDDGARGSAEIKKAGGLVMVESEETAVVYGMPRAAACMSKVDQMLPLGGLVDALVRLLS